MPLSEGTCRDGAAPGLAASPQVTGRWWLWGFWPCCLRLSSVSWPGPPASLPDSPQGAQGIPAAPPWPGFAPPPGCSAPTSLALTYGKIFNWREVTLSCQQEIPAEPFVYLIQQDGNCLSEHGYSIFSWPSGVVPYSGASSGYGGYPWKGGHSRHGSTASLSCTRCCTCLAPWRRLLLMTSF